MTADFDSEEHRLLCHIYATLDRMPNCGCGNPETAYKLIHDLLSLAPLYKDDGWQKARELIGSDGAHQIVMSALTDADLMSHGGSIGGSWITDRGKWFLWAVDQVGGIDGLDGKLDEQGGFPHSWDPETHDMQPCSDACWVMPADSAADDEPRVPAEVIEALELAGRRMLDIEMSTIPKTSPFREMQRPLPPTRCYDASFGRVHYTADCRC